MPLMCSGCKLAREVSENELLVPRTASESQELHFIGILSQPPIACSKAECSEGTVLITLELAFD